jgi:EAL domain-containing protein (putative c-di-GMP-specific phosphodiesterase class I)
MFVVAVRFLLARWPNACVARQLAGTALLLLIAAIAASSWTTSSATDPFGHPGLNILWLFALVGFGAAALHPSMTELALPVHERPAELDWQRGLLLTLSLLMAPVALVAQHTRGDTPTIEMLAGGTALLGILVAARGIVLQRARWQTRANDRLLRLAATDLVVTHGRDAIVRIAVQTACQIAGNRATTALYLTDGPDSEFILQRESGTGSTRVIRERDLPRTVRRVLVAGTTSWLTAGEINAVRVPLDVEAGTAIAAIAPIPGESALKGLFVSTGNRLDHDTARCIETLAAMLSIALDRQQFADELGYVPGRTIHRAEASDGTAFTFVDVDPTDEPTEDTEAAGPSITDALRDAIEGDRLLARFQPRFDLVSGRITAVELTVAWESPDVGPVPSGALSAIAAEHGLSHQLRLAILILGCRQAATWQVQYPDRAIEIVVPLSLSELESQDLAADVEFAIAATGCDARLVLQLTATSLLDADPDTIAALSDLAAIGVQLAVSEAGGSWSDLDRLGGMPLNSIELEASLVHRIDHDERSASIAAHLITRAHSVGAHSVAQGIEQRQQWIALRKLNCDIGQGNLFSPPLTSDELSTLLSRSQQRASAAA